MASGVQGAGSSIVWTPQGLARFWGEVLHWPVVADDRGFLLAVVDGRARRARTDPRVPARARTEVGEEPAAHRREPVGVRPGRGAAPPRASRGAPGRHRPRRRALGGARRPGGQRVLPARAADRSVGASRAAKRRLGRREPRLEGGIGIVDLGTLHVEPSRRAARADLDQDRVRCTSTARECAGEPPVIIATVGTPPSSSRSKRSRNSFVSPVYAALYVGLATTSAPAASTSAFTAATSDRPGKQRGPPIRELDRRQPRHR